MIPETPETGKKPAPCGSQSSRSSSLCRGARLLLSTPTQFAPVTSCLSSVGFDPIFTDAQVSGLLTPSMWCLNTKHGVMGWDEAPHPIRLKTCCDSSPFCYILLLPRMHRVRQEDPHQLERGAASLSFSSYLGSVCIFPKPEKLVPSNM